MESKKQQIQNLIAKYKSLKKEDIKAYSEVNVRKDFIDPLFEILEWNVRDSREYDSESYIRGVGFADTALKLQQKPKIFVEAKKFGIIKPMGFQTTLKGDKIPIDWSDEERQVLHYAVAKIRWNLLYSNLYRGLYCKEYTWS
ncbi:MAG: hypothetical protein ACE5KT_05600 [Methanosarcinales archaeon]